jgi:hypothetical protein
MKSPPFDAVYVSDGFGAIWDRRRTTATAIPTTHGIHHVYLESTKKRNGISFWSIERRTIDCSPVTGGIWGTLGIR